MDFLLLGRNLCLAYSYIIANDCVLLTCPVNNYVSALKNQ